MVEMMALLADEYYLDENETLVVFSNRGSSDLVVGEKRRRLMMRPRQQHSTMCHFPHSWRRYIEHKSGSHFTGLFILSNRHTAGWW